MRRVGDGHRHLYWVLLTTATTCGCTREARPLPEVPEGPVASAAHTEDSPLSASDWSYEGEHGPSNWATLNEAWAACGEAGQSPVDLPLDGLSDAASTAVPSAAPVDKTRDVRLDFLRKGPLVPQFSVLPIELSNDGRLMSLTGAPSQGLSIGGSLAQLESVVIHQPAEHHLGGTVPDLELVLWLKDKNNGRLALSLLFRKGASNGALGSLTGHLPPRGLYERTLISATLALPELVPAGQRLLMYMGSESTPPCQGDVPHLVLAQVAELAPEQLQALIAALPGSSQRPVQPLGDRKVEVVSLAGTSASSASPSSVQSTTGSPATPQGAGALGTNKQKKL